MPRHFMRAMGLAALVFFLYFFDLAGAGMLGPDEPRYASIGRAMAASGDWITPRLWGEPWFEKPALSYWLTAAGFKLGLGPDLAPRLPVALLAVAFLALFYVLLRREFGPRAALFATAMLGTSAIWLGYSHVGVTDLPLSAAWVASMLLALPWVATGDRRGLPWVAALLGVAVLAKGLVPLVLSAPLLWFGRKRLLDLMRPQVAGAFLIVAAPWYVLCWLHNGWPFIHTFFLVHQLGRFASDALQHEQPFWFYLPVVAGALLPWTPLAALAFRNGDPRRRFLLACVLFGLAFFSASTNKLPGYILPLVPLIAALAGDGLAERKNAPWLMAGCAALLVTIPVMAQVLPQALAAGLSRAALPQFSWVCLLPLPLAVLAARVRPAVAVVLIAVGATAGVVYLKATTFPALDRAVSARPLWQKIEGRSNQVCVEDIHRAWRYGLNYYSVVPLPACEASARPVRIAGAPPRVIELRP